MIRAARWCAELALGFVLAGALAVAGIAAYAAAGSADARRRSGDES